MLPLGGLSACAELESGLGLPDCVGLGVGKLSEMGEKRENVVTLLSQNASQNYALSVRDFSCYPSLEGLG